MSAFTPPGPCPACGCDVPAKACSCPTCGASDSDGWKDVEDWETLEDPEDPLPEPSSAELGMDFSKAIIIAVLVLVLSGLWFFWH